MAPIPAAPVANLNVRAIDRRDAQRAVLLEDGSSYVVDRVQSALAQHRPEVVIVEAFRHSGVGYPDVVPCDHPGLELELAA
jgi:hypothetical protein